MEPTIKYSNEISLIGKHGSVTVGKMKNSDTGDTYYYDFRLLIKKENNMPTIEELKEELNKQYNELSMKLKDYTHTEEQ